MGAPIDFKGADIFKVLEFSHPAFCVAYSDIAGNAADFGIGKGRNQPADCVWYDHGVGIDHDQDIVSCFAKGTVQSGGFSGIGLTDQLDPFFCCSETLDDSCCSVDGAIIDHDDLEWGGVVGSNQVTERGFNDTGLIECSQQNASGGRDLCC